jgi:Rrf2 family protein
MSTMLSITSQYALRALSHLARQSGEAVLGRDLARSVEIPANYLSKVLLTLRNAGLVATARGSGGGYRLSRLQCMDTLLCSGCTACWGWD